MRHSLRLLLCLHLIVLSLGFLAYALFPASRQVLSDEDGIVESLTAALFALAFFVAVARFIAAWPVRIWHAIWPILALLGFFDEMSLAERLGMKMPKVLGVKIDAVHDFIDVAFEFLRSRFRKELLLAVAFLLVAALLFLAWRQRVRLARVFRSCPPLLYVVIGGLWFVPAVAIDLHLVQNTPFTVLCEELFEMQVAMALVFANLAIPGKKVNEEA